MPFVNKNDRIANDFKLSLFELMHVNSWEKATLGHEPKGCHEIDPGFGVKMSGWIRFL